MIPDSKSRIWSNGVHIWLVHWMRTGPSGNCSSPRKRLSEELRYVRNAHGRIAGMQYLNRVIQMGSYPGKVFTR